MNWRLASRLSVITLAILVVILVTVIQQHKAVSTTNNSTGAGTAVGMRGTDLENTPAPDFRLTDQFGKQVSLSQFKGKPVVLTFLYTHCPDVCPVTAEHLHTTMQQLGSAAHGVAVLAVSTDPRRDDMNAALSFSKTHNMQDYWHFLIGTQQELAPVWTHYSVSARQIQGKINHSTAVYVIDRQGHERVYLGDDFTPAQLASDLNILLNEK